MARTMTMANEIRDACERAARQPYDWNGAGALPLRSDARRVARFLFTHPDVADVLAYYPLNDPAVGLTESGTIEVSLDTDFEDGPKGGRMLMLAIVCGQAISYIKLFPDGETEIEGVIRLVAPDGHPTNMGPAVAEVVDLIHWVGGGHG